MSPLEVTGTCRSVPGGQDLAEFDDELVWIIGQEIVVPAKAFDVASEDTDEAPCLPAFWPGGDMDQSELLGADVPTARESSALHQPLEAVTRDPLHLYLQDVGRTPLLTAREEIELAKRVERGDKRAEEHMIRSNLRLVVSISKQYHAQEMDLLDLIQEGNLGLMRAVEKFDYRKGCKLSTYATWWIRQAILRAIDTQDRSIRIPMPHIGNINKMRRIELRLVQETGREPSDEELASELGVDPREVPNLRKIAQRAISLETPVGGMSYRVLGDSLLDSSRSDPLEAVFDLMTEESLAKALKGLDRRERKVIKLRFGLTGEHPCSLEEIGRRLKVSGECIRQIESKALKRLKAAQEIQAVRRTPSSPKTDVV